MKPMESFVKIEETSGVDVDPVGMGKATTGDCPSWINVFKRCF